jgi:hypothetical protein
MSEAIPTAGGDQNERRSNAGQEPGRAAPVGAVMRRDESHGSRILSSREKRSLAIALQVSRQKDRRTEFRSRANREAAVVQRSCPVIECRVEDVELDAGPNRAFTPLQPPDRDSSRDGFGRDEPGQRVALGSSADPKFPNLDVAQDRERASGVVVVIV